MISLLLTGLFLYFLDLYQQDSKYKFLIPLPVITLLWVNLHAGYFLGLAFIGIYIVGGLVELLLAEFHKREKLGNIPTLNSILILCGSLASCILATLANPNGIRIILYPFQTLTSPSMQQFIQEWFSPDFHQLMWQPLACFILALIGVGMINKKSISPTNIFLTLVFGYAALHSMRNIPLFVVTAIPVLSEQVGSLVRIQSKIRVTGHLLRLAAFPILLFFMVLVISLSFFKVTRDQSITEIDNFPKTAVDWLLENKPQGNLFNSYGWGGYLIWRTYPEYQVYIDGRADVYGDAFIFDYITLYRARQGWEDKLDGYAIHTVLVESNAPLANMLRQVPAWRIAFKDQLSTIFIR
jgi:ribosomal protein L30/L7E